MFVTVAKKKEKKKLGMEDFQVPSFMLVCLCPVVTQSDSVGFFLLFFLNHGQKMEVSWMKHA